MSFKYQNNPIEIWPGVHVNKEHGASLCAEVEEMQPMSCGHRGCVRLRRPSKHDTLQRDKLHRPPRRLYVQQM